MWVESQNGRVSSPSGRSDRFRRFGDYELLEAIGQGGMGQVFRARVGDRLVALKLGPAEAQLSPKRLARFEREGQITARLRHPHVVPVHDFGLVEGRPFLAYPLIEGARTLGDVLPHWELRQRIVALCDLAGALDYAHGEGVVHRDVKPDNVLVTSDDRVLLADFGLASAVSLERITRSQALMGTPLYMAPEVLTLGGARVGPQADVYALGVMLFEALTGQHPHGDCPELMLDPQRACPRPAAVAPDVCPTLAAVCQRAMATLCRDRYPSAAALARDLTAWLEGGPVSAGGGGRRSAWAALGALAVTAGVGAWAASAGVDAPPPASPAVAPTEAQAAAPTVDLGSARRGAIEALRERLGGLSRTELAAALRALGAWPRAGGPGEEGLARAVLSTVDFAPGDLAVLEGLAESGCRLELDPYAHDLLRRWSKSTFPALDAEQLTQGLRTLEALVAVNVAIEHGVFEVMAPLRPDPESSAVRRYVLLSWREARTGAREQAREQLLALAEREAELPPVSRARAMSAGYGWRDGLLGRPAALGDLGRAVSWDPTCVWARIQLATAWLCHGRVDRAEPEAIRALDDLERFYPMTEDMLVAGTHAKDGLQRLIDVFLITRDAPRARRGLDLLLPLNDTERTLSVQGDEAEVRDYRLEVERLEAR